MSKLMRMIVFFDLPVQTKTQRQAAAKFRNFLLKDGYYMVQYSVYARICSGFDSVSLHEERLKRNLPERGLIRLLTVTEKQYSNSKVLLGPRNIYDFPKQLEEF